MLINLAMRMHWIRKGLLYKPALLPAEHTTPSTGGFVRANLYFRYMPQIVQQEKFDRLRFEYALRSQKPSLQTCLIRS